jgi:hypothetical protein
MTTTNFHNVIHFCYDFVLYIFVIFPHILNFSEKCDTLLDFAEDDVSSAYLTFSYNLLPQGYRDILEYR